MDGVAHNPKDNNLGPGLTDEKIVEAIRKSGYPLQTKICGLLGSDYRIQEEWGFLDEETSQHRALDVLAEKRFYDYPHSERIRPRLSLLIECKQSDLPFIFFSSISRSWLPKFPLLAGLFHDQIKATTDDTRSTFTTTIQSALGFDKQPFCATSVEHCSAFSKVRRRGKEIELSGEDIFQSIVMPLSKAAKDFRRQRDPVKTAHYHDMCVVLPVAVIDAPMIRFEMKDGEPTTIFDPWIRLIRNETFEGEHWSDRTENTAIDIVHKSFFASYLSDHVEPFLAYCAEKAIKHHHEIADGKAFVPGMEKGGFDQFTEMRPRS